MSLSLTDILAESGEIYKMKLLAGQHGCSTSIDWVHLIEDTSIIQFLWSNDLVVTLGVSLQDEDKLFDCIQRLIKRNCAGFIINTGKYIMDIPQYIIDYCEENNFPLITIPWEMRIMPFIKEVSVKCLTAQRDDQDIGNDFIEAFQGKIDINSFRSDVVNRFDVDGYFEIILLRVENAENYNSVQLHRISARIKYYFENIDCKYLLFWYDNCLVLLVNNIEEEEILNLTTRMYNRATRKMSEYPLNIGIGSRVFDFENIPKSFNRALAALRGSTTFNNPIQQFKDLGVYQVLFMINDRTMLKEYYYTRLQPLIDYDKKHNTELETTFYYFLKYSGATQKIAEELYTHRNTINYRISKIKEILDNDLLDHDELFAYQFAFYVKQSLTRY